MTDFETFFDAYVTAALWSTDDHNDEPLDSGEYELAPETLDAMEQDCRAFMEVNEIQIDGNYSQAGHDFWLTRCGHGVGFWDGDWPEPAASILTEESEEFGELWLYVGDDNLIYQSK